MRVQVLTHCESDATPPEEVFLQGLRAGFLEQLLFHFRHRRIDGGRFIRGETNGEMTVLSEKESFLLQRILPDFLATFEHAKEAKAPSTRNKADDKEPTVQLLTKKPD